MNHPYPYIQTIHDFDTSVSAYAIQPISEDESTVSPEENPVMAFGPLGSINIFVGATNAGKSRFLRTLAKNESYGFYSEELHQAITSLINCCRWLAKSEEEVAFSITQGNTRMTDNSPVVLHQLPNWAQEALKGVRSQEDYKLTFSADFFEELIPFFMQLAAGRVGNRSVKSEKVDKDAGDIQIALWAKSLLQGEVAARNRDEELKKSRQVVIAYQLESLSAHKTDFLTFDFDAISECWRAQFIHLWESFEYVREASPPDIDTPPRRFYIPTLRSAVSLIDDQGKRINYDVFERTVRTNYRLEEDLQVFTGNRLYDTIKRDRNGTLEVVARLRDFEKFLGNAFYEGRSVEIVALDEAFEAGQHINVRVQGETPRELHDLGDGINTLVILLYQLFMAEPGSWVFIEEPELNLHPGLQRIFLQTLIENEALQKRNLRVFFTTHSNHLLRMTLRDGTIASHDISVFAFQQRASEKDRFLIRPLVSEHHDALALLGVQNASVLLAQCGIWVEGVTDRQYLRAYLDAYQNSDEFKKSKLKPMREDTHFAFWEYAGSNLAHYLMSDIPRKGTLEAEEYERGKKKVLDHIQSSALCNRIFLLADRDEKKAKKHETLKAMAKGRNNFRYYVTPCIEIENLLSPSELSACLPKFLKGDAFTGFSSNQADYRDTRLGTFLRKKFRAGFADSWVEKSGTLSTDRKNRLCELAVDKIEWSIMSKDAKALAKALYKFIAEHNDI